jgi:hypothetical protein
MQVHDALANKQTQSRAVAALQFVGIELDDLMEELLLILCG